jgi:hypothetical protein
MPQIIEQLLITKFMLEPPNRRCNSRRIRTFGRSKRGGYKCSRTEIQKSTYAEEETGDETEIDQSFA